MEINPLIITGDERVVALDAKLDVEDDSMFRHADLRDLRDRSQEDALEAQASDMEIAYVNLDGSVGCLVNGAGLAMATLDVTNAAGAAPANFLDVGGGARRRKGSQRGEHHPVRPQGGPGADQRFRRHSALRHRGPGHRPGL